ncbi:MAG: hypothetical protein J6Y78_03145 [Paludibacteraceae bacterium]|nr:hypothetical protein [Paludibacteraceae bacterium]
MDWAHIVRYFHENENGEIYDKIWVGKYYRNCKMFYELRKDMLLNKVRKATIKVKFEKRNYIHIATEEMGFFTLSLTKQKFE